MNTDTQIDPNVQKWGYRSAWLPRSWASDTRHITRWFRLTSLVEAEGAEVELFTRVLGWDSSTPPAWAAPHRQGRVRVECLETALASPEDLFSPNDIREFERGHREARRVQLPVIDWHSEYDATAWQLAVPVVAYELWPSSPRYLNCLQEWNSLGPDEKAAVGVPRGAPGYLSSMIMLIPQVGSFFHGPHHLVVAGDQHLARTFAVFDETHDGPVTLGRVSSPLVPEPWPQEFSGQDLPLDRVRLHYRDANLCSLGEKLPETTPAVFRLPRSHHGLSGSDSTVGVVAQAGTVDICRTGLIRGLSQGYFTTEPWRARVASLGFSAPARVLYVPRSPEGADSAFSELRRLGTPGSLWIVDPYADTVTLERLQETLSGARLLTDRKKSKGLTTDWLRRNAIEARCLANLHDRFIVGSRSAVLVGSSLTGLGNSHCFLVVVDAVMQSELVRVFEVLWNDAKPL